MEREEINNLVEKNRNAGFTLVEMLIAMLISSLIILGVSQFMVTSSNVYKGVNHQVDVQMESQDCVNAISNRLMEANNVKFINQSSGAYIEVFYDLKPGANFKSVRQDIFWLDKKEHNMYLFVCDSASDYSDAFGAHTKGELFAEGMLGVNLSVGSDDKKFDEALFDKDIDFCYSDKLVAYSKNQDIQLNIKMQSDADKVGKANSYQFTYVINSSVAPRNEIVPLDS
ncbi:MAG: prepilin-type N-terminal cleavage/methylation domain-containing protein [Lachnospiraceae bacterium]|nr:prepilin-type N-terminal cleavage/methylation domain-containing protein [Lachnospiraceae bacterium]